MSNKVALVGMDGIIPEFCEKFMAEGWMPNLKQLKERGFWTDAIPSVPAWTPSNWASIITGAQTSTHSMDGFEVHYPGEPLPYEMTDFHRGFDSTLLKAETFWAAAAKAGKKSIIFKFPNTWPIQLKAGEGIQIGGASGFGGLRNYLDIWHAHCFTTDTSIKGATPVNLKPAEGWSNLPEAVSRGLECELQIELNRPRDTAVFYGLVYASEPGGSYDRLLVCQSKDGAEALATIHPGQWSDWLIGTFDPAKATEPGGFRLKLIELSPDAGQFKLYMTPNHPLAGYTFPDHIAQEIFEVAGPFPEYTSLHLELYRWVDRETQIEIYDSHAAWLVKVADYVMKNHEWDIFVTQFHPIDYAQHIYMGAISPCHPDYDEKDEELGWWGMRQVYRVADKLLGGIMHSVGEDGIVIMTGDHGAEVLHHIFYPNNLLEQAGLLKVRLNAKGEYEPVWEETKAYAFGPCYVYINLKGREPHGIVEPGDEYEAVREQVLKLFRSVRCEQTDTYPVYMVMRREEADYFGLYGDQPGDIVYIMDVGYDSGAPVRMGKSAYRAGVTDDRQYFKATRLWTEYTGDHSAYPPFSKRNRTLTVMSGPGIRKNVKRDTPIRLIDIAPTVSYLLEAPYATETEGSLILDALE